LGSQDNIPSCRGDTCPSFVLPRRFFCVLFPQEPFLIFPRFTYLFSRSDPRDYWCFQRCGSRPVKSFIAFLISFLCMHRFPLEYDYKPFRAGSFPFQRPPRHPIDALSGLLVLPFLPHLTALSKLSFEPPSRITRGHGLSLVTPGTVFLSLFLFPDPPRSRQFLRWTFSEDMAR